MAVKPHRVWRVGAVDFVNTLPLVDGLENLADVEIRYSPPSGLVGMLERDEADVALCSIIDYQKSRLALKIVPAGILGCDGSTMTVRLFSRVPIARIRQVHCDTDSHTSVALLRILLHDVHGVKATFVDYDARSAAGTGESGDGRNAGPTEEWPETMLLIGDKVVTDARAAIRYPYQLDLGAEWKEMTGLPFVFAAWMAKRDRDTAVVGAVLDRQRRHNRERLGRILSRRVEGRGWPIELARIYLRDMLRYEWTERARAGVERFFERCRALAIIDEVRAMEFEAVGFDAVVAAPAPASPPRVAAAVATTGAV